jgi:uncharacterized protein
LLLLFIGLPLFYFFNLIPFHKFVPLLVVFLVMLFLILRDKSFSRKKFGLNGFREWQPIFVRFLVFALLSALIIRFFFPEYFFKLPRERLNLWFMVIVFYPLWSVFPQEFIYRTWFFRRYRHLIKKEWVFILLNGALFSFSHIIFRNWLAIAMTFVGGIMFAWTYRKSNSLLVVFIEHMLYGNYIYTVGIGQFFYLPMGGE